MRLTRTGSIATAVLMTIVVAGCGGEEPAAAPGTTGTTPTAAPTTPTLTPTVPAAESITALSADALVKKAKTAAKAAASVRVRGTMSDDDGKPMKLDLSLATKGGSGTITMDGTSIKVLVVGKTAYMQLSDAFWRQQTKSKQEADLIIGVVGGKWIKLALSNKDFGELAAFASKPTFFDGLFDETGSVRKSGTKTIDGVPCIGLSDDEGTLWVDAVSARPIRLEVPDKTKATTESLSFSQYNQIKEPKAPPASKVIDGKDIGM